MASDLLTFGHLFTYATISSIFVHTTNMISHPTPTTEWKIGWPPAAFPFPNYQHVSCTQWKKIYLGWQPMMAQESLFKETYFHWSPEIFFQL